MDTPVTVFYSYAQNSQDEHLRKKLEAHLKSLEHAGRITGWHRSNILPGQVSKNVVDQHLNHAQLILLLISADFINSPYCFDVEMKRALELQKQGKAHVLPILLRPVFYENAPFADLEVLPSNKRAITSWTHPDEAFMDVVQGIDRVLKNISSSTYSASVPMKNVQENNFYGPVQGAVIGDSNIVVSHYYSSTPSSSPVPSTQQTSGCDVLLVTVTEVEVRAVLSAHKQVTQRDPIRHYIGNKTYFDLGEIGNVTIFLVQSEMGAGGPGGAQSTVQEGIRALSPTAVIMVGIAFGMKPRKQHLGDILISRQLMEYDLQRISTDREGELVSIPRGDRSLASIRLLDRVRSGLINWQGANVDIGLMLSGGKLVDHLDMRNHLESLEPEAIGGEMEGAGLYAAAQYHKVDWILIKAICDWADGKKAVNKAQRQQQAASNAALFTLHVIGQGGLAIHQHRPH